MNKISIGHLNNQRAAQAFCDYLKTKNINAWVENDQHNFQVVIDSLDSEDIASAELRDFLSNPGDRKYLDASWNTGTTAANISFNSSSHSDGFNFKEFLSRAGIMTKTLVFISVAVTFITAFGENTQLTQFLFISTPGYYPTGLTEILSGQIWRLLTPVFLHFMTIHLLFNMMWLWDLGGSVERIQSAQFLLFFVVSIGILSNVIQYYTTGHSAFGGMSGVVYGLLGYTWIRSIKQGSAYHLHKSIIILMLGWLVLGYTGYLGPIANAAHLSGLMLGLAYGFAWNNMNEK